MAIRRDKSPIRKQFGPVSPEATPRRHLTWRSASLKLSHYRIIRGLRAAASVDRLANCEDAAERAVRVVEPSLTRHYPALQ